MSAPDIVVVGAGPAGLATAAACQRVGLETVCLTADAALPWPNNYGLWADELAALDLARFAAHAWPRARVILDEPRQHAFDRAYVQLDNAALRDHLAAQVEIRVDRALALRDGALTLAGGDALRPRLVIDATGHRPQLVVRDARVAPGFQAALGWRATVEGWPFPLDEVRLMDFSDAAPGETSPPTFLYAMPFGPHDVFVEETSLCARPAVDFDRLADRLRARLGTLGVTVRSIEHTERCLIPMGDALPARGPVVGVGAAASMVHPATGYMVGSALRAARRLADAVRAALDEGRDPAVAGWAAVWPRDHVRTRRLYEFGMGALLTMDLADLRDFFDAFFHAPPAVRWRYLAGTATPAEAAAAMRAVFARLPNRLRGRLVGRSFGPAGWRMLRALAG